MPRAIVNILRRWIGEGYADVIQGTGGNLIRHNHRFTQQLPIGCGAYAYGVRPGRCMSCADSGYGKVYILNIFPIVPYGNLQIVKLIRAIVYARAGIHMDKAWRQLSRHNVEIHIHGAGICTADTTDDNRRPFRHIRIRSRTYGRIISVTIIALVCGNLILIGCQNPIIRIPDLNVI